MPSRIRLATCVGVRRRDWRTVGLRRRVDEDAAHVYSSSHMLIPCNQPALFDRGGPGGDAARSSRGAIRRRSTGRDEAVRVADVSRMLGDPGRV